MIIIFPINIPVLTGNQYYIIPQQSKTNSEEVTYCKKTFSKHTFL